MPPGETKKEESQQQQLREIFWRRRRGVRRGASNKKLPNVNLNKGKGGGDDRKCR